jgi:hypothetical protein
VLAVCLLAAGCGASASGPYHLSGKVTFKGRPLPRGRIFFLPDSARGNSGQGGFAEIKDGAYDTRDRGGATPGGALVVRIDGFDGNTTAGNLVGEPLFLTYEVAVEVPRADGTRDFDVAASAARTLSKGAAPPP